MDILHRGKYKRLSRQQRRCWLRGQLGDALHAVLCAAGYNLRWLMQGVVRLGIKPIFCARGGWLGGRCSTAVILNWSLPPAVSVGFEIENEFCRADYGFAWA